MKQLNLLDDLSERKRGAFAGFTLIELMVTVAVIGILSSTAIPNYRNIVGIVHAKANITQMAEMRKIIRTYANENDGRYPTNFNLVTGNFPTPPVCPISNLTYVYASDGSGYSLTCPGQPTYPAPYLNIAINYDPNTPGSTDDIFYDLGGSNQTL